MPSVKQSGRIFDANSISRYSMIAWLSIFFSFYLQRDEDDNAQIRIATPVALWTEIDNNFSFPSPLQLPLIHPCTNLHELQQFISGESNIAPDLIDESFHIPPVGERFMRFNDQNKEEDVNKPTLEMKLMSMLVEQPEGTDLTKLWRLRAANKRANSTKSALNTNQCGSDNSTIEDRIVMEFKNIGLFEGIQFNVRIKIDV